MFSASFPAGESQFRIGTKVVITTLLFRKRHRFSRPDVFNVISYACLPGNRNPATRIHFSSRRIRFPSSCPPSSYARGSLRCDGFACGVEDSPHSDGKKTTWETKNVTSRNYLPANVTNIVMQIRQEEESQGYGK